MSENKTRPTDASVMDFITAVENNTRREDSLVLLERFNQLTGMSPRLWGPSLIGYGEYHYKYDSGREGDYFLTGFSPRKSAMTVYVMPGFSEFQSELNRLGPHKHSSSCLYITRLARVDMDVLDEIVTKGVEIMRQRYDWKAS